MTDLDTAPVGRLDRLRTHPAFVRWFSRLHVRLYRWSGGRILGDILGAPVLLLTTAGRKTGRPRTTPLLYVADGERLVVAASNGGSDRPPAWWLNLRGRGEGEIEIGRDRRRVRAVVAAGAERDRLWDALVRVYPDYALYRRKTAREIPVVLLEPVAGDGTD